MNKRIVCQVNRDIGGRFGKISDLSLKNLGTGVCGCVCSRYFKGIEANSSPCVLVKHELRQEFKNQN